MPGAVTKTLPVALVLLFGCHHGAPEGPRPIGSQLIGFTWVLRSLKGQPVGMGDRGREITLRFGADGVASGFGGCNGYRASYRSEHELLHFQPAATTRKACSAGSSIEQNLLLTLPVVRRWRVTGRRLVLGGDDGPIAELDRR